MDDKKKRLFVLLAAAVLAAAFLTAGLLLLPQELIVQIGSDGSVSSTLPRVAGLLIPFAISVLFPLIYYFNADRKYLIAGCVGVLANILLFAFNL